MSQSLRLGGSKTIFMTTVDKLKDAIAQINAHNASIDAVENFKKHATEAIRRCEGKTAFETALFLKFETNHSGCAASTRLDVRTASEKTARLDITEKFRPEMFHAMKAVFAILQMAMEAERDRLGKEAEGIQLSGTED